MVTLVGKTVGESRVKKITGTSCNREYLNQVKRLDLINHNVAVQFDEPPFYLKIVKEMCNYKMQLQKTDFGSDSKF